MIEIRYQDDDGVTRQHQHEISADSLSEIDAAEDYPAEVDGPDLASPSLATVDDNQGRDPIRSYLRKMSSVALLTREGEVELAKRIEDGRRRVLLALLNTTAVTCKLVELGNAMQQRTTHVDTPAREMDEDPAEPHESARAERIGKVMDDVRRLHRRLLRAAIDAESAIATARDRGRCELASTQHEMADALLNLHIDPKQLAHIIAQLDSLMASIEAARADIAYCQRIGSKADVLPDERVRLAEIVHNAQKAIRLVEEEVDMPEQLLRDTLEEIREGTRQAETAKAEMVKRNLRLVIFVAKKHINRSELHFMDLVQEGNIGLIKAVERYDYKMGYKFATYAIWWIRQAIAFAVTDQSRTIRIPAHVVEATSKVKRMQRRLIQKFGREVTVEEIAKELDLSVEKVNEVLGAAEPTVSLDTPVGPDGEAHLGDFIEDERVTSAFDSLASNSLARQTREILATLDPREQEVLRLRFGIDESAAQTLEEVGRSFALTRERIRQIENRGLEKLRVRSRALGLGSFIEGHRAG